MSVNSASITTQAITQAITQHAQYQQTYAQNRKLSVLDRQADPQSKLEPFSKLQSVSVLNQELIIQIKEDMNKMLLQNQPTSEAQPTDTYERPLPPKIELMKIILEGYFGKEFGEFFNEVDFQQKSDSDVKDPAQENILADDENQLIDIEGVQFNATDLLKVEQ